MRHTLLIALTLLLALGAPRSALATVVEDVTVERAVALASDIVIGVVTARESFRAPGGAILTDHQVAVEQTLRGPAKAGETLLLRHLGGEIGADFMLVAGMPELAPGERVLLILTTAPDGTRRTLGLFLGAYTIVAGADGPIAVQKPSAGAERVGHPPCCTLPERAPLAELVRLLAAAAETR